MQSTLFAAGHSNFSEGSLQGHTEDGCVWCSSMHSFSTVQKHNFCTSLFLPQVNAKILKAATNDIRTLSVSEPDLEQMAREARCAAFACGAALIVATQQKESFFAILLKDPKVADPSGEQCSLCLLSVCDDGYTAEGEFLCHTAQRPKSG